MTYEDWLRNWDFKRCLQALRIFFNVVKNLAGVSSQFFFELLEVVLAYCSQVQRKT